MADSFTIISMMFTALALIAVLSNDPGQRRRAKEVLTMLLDAISTVACSRRDPDTGSPG